MAKQCEKCNFSNEDSKLFCARCGAPLEHNLQVIMDLKEVTKMMPVSTPQPVRQKPQ